MKELKEELHSKRTVTLIISSIIWTIIAHGMMLFNKYSFHDDAVFFNGIGSDIPLGRWMLFLMGKTVSFFHQTNLVSLPLINGIFTILFLVAIIYILLQGLDIHSTTSIILISGIMISFPAITGLLIFMFTAPYYYCGALLGVFGIYLFFRKKSFAMGLLCSFLIACSIGTYQANIGICLCTFLLFMLKDINDKQLDWKGFFRLIVYDVGICIASLLEYLIINKVFLSAFDTTMSSYSGINSFGITNLQGYLKRIALAYYRFFIPHDNHCAGNYPNASKYFYMAFLILSIILLILWVMNMKKGYPTKVKQIAVILIVFPLASYIVYVMQDVDKIQARMCFSEVMIFLLIIWVLEIKSTLTSRCYLYIKKAIIVIMGIILYLNIRFANTCYVKADILQAQSIGFFNTLITKIKMTNGYTDKTPLVFINSLPREDNSFAGTNYLFNGISLYPYSEDNLLNDYAWKETMKLWCGFNQPEGNPSDFTGNEQVKEMPSYPDDGSIEMIDGTIVVKFPDEPSEE